MDLQKFLCNIFLPFSGGTASGFYSSEDEEITPRMYLLSRMKQTNLEPVMLHVGSLDQGQVFILVTNKSIFVWCGTKVPRL